LKRPRSNVATDNESSLISNGLLLPLQKVAIDFLVGLQLEKVPTNCTRSLQGNREWQPSTPENLHLITMMLMASWRPKEEIKSKEEADRTS
jgi:hypothetical protein